MKPAVLAILVLEDGTAFHGTSFGAAAEVVGELVVCTSMAGYQQILADSASAERIVIFTLPELGNVGISGKDPTASAIQALGVVAKHVALAPSNHESRLSLPSWMVGGGVPGIQGLDTRKLTRHLRIHGPMAGAISSLEGADEGVLLEKVRTFRSERIAKRADPRGTGREG